MEEWDIIGVDRNKTGRIAIRGQHLNKGDYHLVVLNLIINSNDQILVTRRSKHKNGALLWEFCGGAVLAGEDSRAGALREMSEEVGIHVAYDDLNGKIIGQASFEKPHGWLADIWLFHTDYTIADLKLQSKEVCDAKWMNRNEVIDLIESGDFFKGQVFIDEVFSKGIL